MACIPDDATYSTESPEIHRLGDNPRSFIKRQRASFRETFEIEFDRSCVPKRRPAKAIAAPQNAFIRRPSVAEDYQLPVATATPSLKLARKRVHRCQRPYCARTSAPIVPGHRGKRRSSASSTVSENTQTRNPRIEQTPAPQADSGDQSEALLNADRMYIETSTCISGRITSVYGDRYAKGGKTNQSCRLQQATQKNLKIRPRARSAWNVGLAVRNGLLE